jgi:hypothetical protein
LPTPSQNNDRAIRRDKNFVAQPEAIIAINFVKGVTYVKRAFAMGITITNRGLLSPLGENITETDKFPPIAISSHQGLRVKQTNNWWSVPFAEIVQGCLKGLRQSLAGKSAPHENGGNGDREPQEESGWTSHKVTHPQNLGNTFG